MRGRETCSVWGICNIRWGKNTAILVTVIISEMFNLEEHSLDSESVTQRNERGSENLSNTLSALQALEHSRASVTRALHFKNFPETFRD